MAKYKSRHDKSGGYHSKRYIENKNQEIKRKPKIEPEEIQKAKQYTNDVKEATSEAEEFEEEPVKKTNPAVIVVLVILLIIALGAAAFAVYHFILNPQKPAQETVATTAATLAPATKQEATTEATESADEILSQQAEEYVSKMSSDEKIYQMLIVDPETLTGVDEVTMAGDTTKEALTKYPVGGVILFEQNMEDSDQTKEMISNMQSFSKTPLLISVDEEGGDTSRVENALGTTALQNMYTYRHDGTTTATANAKQIAKDISALGFNLDLAPVADVWTNKDNTVIGERAYSDDFTEAAKLVASAVKGFEAEKVMSTLKHFPGHGDTAEDSHYQLAYTSKTKDELLKEELLPFNAGINAGADMVMAGHIVVSEMDENYPATLSSVVVPELLRTEMKYDGIVISDSMQMAAITDNFEIADIVKRSINDATIDIILMPSDIEAYVTAIKEGITNGDIKQESIDNSVKKIIKLKIKNGLITPDKTTNNVTATETVEAVSTVTETETVGNIATLNVNE